VSTNIQPALPTALRWRQLKWTQRRYELNAGAETIARLEYRGTWRPVAHAYIADHDLTFRSSLFKQDVAIFDEITQQQIGAFERKRKPIASFPSGRQFRWVRNGFWSPTWSFVAADNETVLTMKMKYEFFRSSCEVNLSANAYKYPEVRVLVVLGWYLMLAAAQSAAAAS
jgi:hypothetical protein